MKNGSLSSQASQPVVIPKNQSTTSFEDSNNKSKPSLIMNETPALLIQPGKNQTIPEANQDEELNTMQINIPEPEQPKQSTERVSEVQHQQSVTYQPQRPSFQKTIGESGADSNDQYSFKEEQHQMTPGINYQEAGRDIMTAPSGFSRKRLNNINGKIYKAFKESELLKAANLYGQFDKKGNIYENKLYVKTSINQAKLHNDQVNYDAAMEGTPEEDARINQASMSDRAEITAPGDRSQKSFTKASITNKSHMSQSTNFNVNQGFIKPQTAQNVSRRITSPFKTSLNNKPVDPFTMSMTRGTFSRAGGPRINNTGESYDLSNKNSIYQQIQQQNIEVNRSATISKREKDTVSRSFKNAQKSFVKCQTLNELQSRGWSQADMDYGLVAIATGGKNNTFRHAANLQTNDCELYSQQGFNVTANGSKLGHQPNSSLYYYKGPNKQTKVVNLTDRVAVFECAKEMNKASKTFYSNCMDAKYLSSVYINDRAPAGFSQKIQNKAYRANTETTQKDGIFNATKALSKPVLLNHTRTPYNIINPTMSYDSGKLTQVLQDMQPLMKPSATINTILTGKCHQKYGISDFNQNANMGATKFNDKYQMAYTQDQKLFRRVNGEFTSFADVMNKNKV